MRQVKTRITLTALAALALVLALGASTASAKSIVDYFGTDPSLGQGSLGGEFRNPSGIAVNQTGAGPAGRGDVYVVDPGPSNPPRLDRIQRFSRDDNGTPTFPYDDTWIFVSAWGADVVQDGGLGDRGDADDANYEICAVAAQCKAGVPSGGNGTAGGNGSLASPRDIAIDQDTGNVYVLLNDARVNVYEGDGTFVRSFGFDVVDSGDGEQPAPNEIQQLTVTATGGRFALGFGAGITGARGKGLTSRGSRLVSSVASTSGAFASGQVLTGSGSGIPTLFSPGTTITAVDNDAATLTISQGATNTTNSTQPGDLIGYDLDFDATAQEIEDALDSLPTIGGVGGTVEVTGANPFTIEFSGTLAGDDVGPIQTHTGGLSGATPSATITTTQVGGAYEVCEAADADICGGGAGGAAVGQLNAAAGIAVSPPDFNPATGSVFVADTGNQRVNTYALDGSGPDSFGSAAQFTDRAGFGTRLQPEKVAVDSRGIVYATDSQGFQLDEIERYDTEDANGNGVGFLAPIPGGIDEEQQFRINAASGTFKLRFGPDTTVDLPFSVPAEDSGTPAIDSVRESLEALPSLDPGDIRVSGGPGNATGSSPYTVSFTGGQRFTDTDQIEVLPGTTPLDGGTGINLRILVFGNDDRDAQRQIFVHSTSGNYRLVFAGTETTGDIAFNAPPTGAGSVQAALEGLPSIDPGDVSVSGGLGNSTASSPYLVTFTGALGRRGISLETVPGTTPLDGGLGGFSHTTQEGQAGLASGATSAMTVDPDTDGGGPDTDVLYLARFSGIQQVGPVNRPGEIAPPTVADLAHGVGQISPSGFAIDETSGHLYASATSGAGQRAHGVYVFHDAGSDPTARLDSLTDETATSVRANARIDPNGPPLVSYRFEYSRNGTDWIPFGTTALGIQDDEQEISEVLSAPGAGFAPNTDYEVRLVVTKKFAASIVTDPPLSFRTDPAPPEVETTGAPMRSTTTAHLNGLVGPRNSATTFRFQYVTEEAFAATQFTDLSSGGQTAPVAAGSDDTIKLAAAEIEGLDPNTDYRYRITADNGNPGSPVFGAPMSVRTRATDELPSQNRELPGPPDSDRAYELVSVPDSAGNPVLGGWGFSDDGNRASYNLNGGSSIADRGSLFSIYRSERSETSPHVGGWQTQWITPPSTELRGNWWWAETNPDLSNFIGVDMNVTEFATTLWSFGLRGFTRLVDIDPPRDFDLHSLVFASEDTSRVIAEINGGSLDPAFPAASQEENFYEISAGGPPELLSLLPGERVAACGAQNSTFAYQLPETREARVLSADGQRLFFPSRGDNCSAPSQLYMRDLLADESTLLSGPPLSGSACGAGFSRSTPEAVFFWTQTRLTAEDTEAGSCVDSGSPPDGDVYRYDFAAERLACVTCAVGDSDANVFVAMDNARSASGHIGVAEDGSRLYFRSTGSLMPGVPAGSAYRLDLETDDLAPLPGLGATVLGPAFVDMNPDGSVLVFGSNNSELNPLGEGLDNGGAQQYYRYDDTDRSLVCISCPSDGSPAAGVFAGGDVWRNMSPLTVDGDTYAFTTREALLDVDQNTPSFGGQPNEGADVYEWRDGRHILVTDGLTNWPALTSDSGSEPRVLGVSSSGRDVFFTAAAKLTPDAIDDFTRLYTARIGGGFEFPEPDPPCPLEVCQGTPRGAPVDPVPSSESFSGRGNPAPEAQSCTPAATRQAKRLSKQAVGLRKKAARIAKNNPKRAKALRSKARLKARSAKQKSRAARSCRRANREAQR